MRPLRPALRSPAKGMADARPSLCEQAPLRRAKQRPLRLKLSVRVACGPRGEEESDEG